MFGIYTELRACKSLQSVLNSDASFALRTGLHALQRHFSLRAQKGEKNNNNNFTLKEGWSDTSSPGCAWEKKPKTTKTKGELN